jgi:hypothetical protein
MTCHIVLSEGRVNIFNLRNNLARDVRLIYLSYPLITCFWTYEGFCLFESVPQKATHILNVIRIWRYRLI